mmetsp:Transcript_39436/g.73528  ORF Transcript_39436/g.73528 Transcript_39436/m.73528 type:complete len:168 (-) Transcript_39436:9-512(-)
MEPEAVKPTLPAQPDPISNLDAMCVLGGVGCWYFVRENIGEAWLLRIGPNWPVRLMGAALMAGSVSLRMTAMDCFRLRKTPLTHKQESKVLVTDGPFEWSRNPMYLSMLGNISSVGLMMNSWWGVAAAVPFAAYLHFLIIPSEEAYLRARFESYEKYAERTPRWLFV